jgi:hypothetical protein
MPPKQPEKTPQQEFAETDPYGPETCFCTSGKDAVYRLNRDADGNIVSAQALSPEELEASKPPEKKRKRA